MKSIIIDNLYKNKKQFHHYSPVFIKPLLYVIKKYIPILIFVPFVLLIRIMKKFVVIRLGPLKSNRIGHFGGNTEIYLCERNQNILTKKYKDFFYLKLPVSNQQLLKMWKRNNLKIYQIFKYIEKANIALPGGKRHHLILPSDRDVNDYFSHSKPSLYFTDTEIKLGMKFLESFKGFKNGRFVCFHGRDPAYIRNFESRTRRVHSRKHNYRNSDIDNFVLAMKKLSRKGYYVFRMGSLVQKSLDIHNNKIIDYATNGMRTDFLDIFLSGNCRFFVGSSSGLSSVASIFRVPLLSVNMIPLEYSVTFLENSIFIPKKLWIINEHRFMRFSEIFESGAGRFLHTENYKELGLEVIENTPEEISDAVLEMENRIEGSWVGDHEDEKLQKRFWELFPRSEHVYSRIYEIRTPLHGKIRSRIGAAFLRQNIELLA